MKLTIENIITDYYKQNQTKQYKRIRAKAKEMQKNWKMSYSQAFDICFRDLY